MKVRIHPSLLPAAAAISLLLSPAPLLGQAGSNEGDEDFGFAQIEMLTTVMEVIREQYHDKDQVSYQKLMNSALEGMLANLDPHCQFMSKEVLENMQRQTGGTYEGVGITVAMRNERVTIVAVREDGPAARAGALPGDQIVKINEQTADDLGLAKAMQLMRGKPGQPLSLTVRRPSNGDVLELEMVREVIRESTIVDVTMLKPRYAGDRKIGYARMTQFGRATVPDLIDALDRLEQKGMEAFILDLRNNPGGLLTSAVNTCAEFLPPETLVLTTEGRDPSNTDTYSTPSRKQRTREYPLAILVNHGSASGSEVVAGALQDLKRAIIVGTKTFGKGSVQSIFPVPLGDGSALRLTTARYYTPSKRTIHENGIEPNIVSVLTPEDEAKLMKWFRRETLEPSERKKLDEWTDRQLARATDALKGALIYREITGESAPAPENPSDSAPDSETTAAPQTENTGAPGEAEPVPVETD